MRPFPRIKDDLPVILNGTFNGTAISPSNLSLGGAFLRAQLSASKIADSISFKYYLQGYG